MDTKNLKTNTECKSTELISILAQNFSGRMNLARIKFPGLFICALCKVQKVCYAKVATAFERGAKTESSLRRIQRFMAEYALDAALIARLIFKILPHQPPYHLIMDRTNWKLGEQNLNVLTLALAYQGASFPILILMLDKRGNSNTHEHVRLMNKYIGLFGRHTIYCLTADREFVGEDWMEYLNNSQIRYHIRIRGNFYVYDPEDPHKKPFKVSWMFNRLRCAEYDFSHRIYRVNGQLCYLSASKAKNKDGVHELQILISYNKPEEAHRIYRDRWQIETMFRGLKTGGFNIEDTHLTDLERIEKLISIVMVAFAWHM